MIFKYKGQEMEVPDNFIVMCGQHAEERGMTLEEYIAEAFTMLKNSEEHDTGTAPPISKDNAERGSW
jgi:hypothetical protein